VTMPNRFSSTWVIYFIVTRLHLWASDRSC